MSKGLEALKRIRLQGFVFNDRHNPQDLDTIEKELKALEIIKRCRVDFHIFKRYTRYGLEQYNDEVWDNERLTQ